jgi:hypothetical protein
LKHRFRGGAACLVVDNQNIDNSWVLLLDLFIDRQVLIIGGVDLDIGRVAHINSGSYRGEAETLKRK